MGFFKKSTDELERELMKAKKQREILEKKAREKDIEINKKIAEKEKREQLMFEIKRLKQKPRNKAELLIKKERVKKAKKIARSISSNIGRGVIKFLIHADKVYNQPQPKKRRKSVKKRAGKRK